MTPGNHLDAVVVGAGPNGLAAAIALQRAGRQVHVIEADERIGGGCRTADLTLPGFHHDVCSAVHPLGRSSPFFASLPLERHGLHWIESPVEMAHPLDGGRAALVLRDVDATANGLGRDAGRYRALVGQPSRAWATIARDLLGPLRPFRALRHPLTSVGLAARGILPTAALVRAFRTEEARAILAGVSAHSMLPLDALATGMFGTTLLASAHAVGWPIPAGGSQAIVDALAAYLVELGGSIETGMRIERMGQLPSHRAALLDVTPRQLLAIAGDRIRGAYAAQLRRFRYGPGVFKLDLALDGPVPWTNPRVGDAITVHVGGTYEEIATSEHAVHRGRVSDRPFVLVAQPSRFDPTRAPAGKHTLWAYCHVPPGAETDMTEPILRQIERFAPGFRDLIIGRHAIGPAAMEAYNANYVGGDINGGLQSLAQFVTRPAVRLDPYSTPDPGIFICSSSTPPGGGVHGLCGAHAAASALRDVLA